MTDTESPDRDESVEALTADLPRRLRRAQQVGAAIAVAVFAVAALILRLVVQDQVGLQDAIAGGFEFLAALCLGPAVGILVTLRTINRAMAQTLQPSPTGRRIRAAIQGRPVHNRVVVLDGDEEARALRYAGLAAAALPAQGLGSLGTSFAVLFNGLALFTNDLNSPHRGTIAVNTVLVVFLIAGVIAITCMQPLQRRSARRAAAYLHLQSSTGSASAAS